MKIFSLLGMVVDSTIVNMDGKFETFFKTDECAVVRTDNVNIIDRYIMPLCENSGAELHDIISGGRWYMADLKFGRNPHSNRGELQSVDFFNSNNKRTTYEVGSRILEELVESAMDELYFTICDEIL